MIKLEIIKIENYLYLLKSEDGKEYSINLEFLDLQEIFQRNVEIYRQSAKGFGTGKTPVPKYAL